MATTIKREGSELPSGFFKTVFVIGLGFFTMGLMDPLYDSFVPLLYGEYVSSAREIGFFMTLDNIFALFLIPLVSRWSDSLKTSWGRRMPLIVIFVPLSGLLFMGIPLGAKAIGSVLLLRLVVIGFNLVKQSARGPVVALMPDLVAAEHRSVANGVINTMGGIAAIVGTIGLAPLFDITIQLPSGESLQGLLPFAIAGILVIVAVIVLKALVREPSTLPSGESKGEVLSDDAPADETEAPEQFVRFSLKNIPADSVKILAALFFWFIAYQGVLPFLTTYVVNYLGMSKGLAGMSAGAVGVAYALFAVPSGFLARKLGRRRVISLALVVVSIALALSFFHYPLTLGLGSMASWIVLLVILFGFGIAWGAVITNSFPMLWQLSKRSNLGSYTGAYYFFSQGAAIVAPILFGWAIDLAGGVRGGSPLGVDQGEEGLGIRIIFAMGSFFMVVALVILSRVKGGEVGNE